MSTQVAALKQRVLQHARANRPFLMRLISGFTAQGLNQTATIALQLLTVPALLHAWGMERYGGWLLLSVLPGYFGLSDMGFAQAAANDMTVSLTKGDAGAALRTFQSILALCSGLAVLLLFIAMGLAVAAPMVAWLHLSQITAAEARWVVALFGIYSAATLVMGVASGAFRAQGRFASMVAINTTTRFGEGLLIVGLALAGLGVVGAAVGMACARLFGLIAAFVILRGSSRHFPLGFGHAHVQEIRRLTPYSLSFMAFPLGHALILQGVLTLIGLFAPASVALYSTARTLVRIGANALGMINNVFLYDYARLLSTDRARFGSAFRLHLSLIGAAAILYVAAMIWVAPWFYPIWTGRRMHLSHALLLALVASALAEIVWAFLQTPLLAINAHMRIATNYLIGAAIAAGAIALLLKTGAPVWSAPLVQGAVYLALAAFVGVRLGRTTRIDVASEARGDV